MTPDEFWARSGNWYVVHCQSGTEKSTVRNMKARISSMNMESRIFEVVIPMEEVTEFKGGARSTSLKKVFSGYIMVRCIMDNDVWYAIKGTPGVIGIPGASRRMPSPMSRREVERFLLPKEEPIRITPTSAGYEVGEVVHLKGGNFDGFTATIQEVNVDKGEVQVLTNLFGREVKMTISLDKVVKL